MEKPSLLYVLKGYICFDHIYLPYFHVTTPAQELKGRIASMEVESAGAPMVRLHFDATGSYLIVNFCLLMFIPYHQLQSYVVFTAAH